MAKKPFAKQRPPQHNSSNKWLPEGVEVRTIGISIEGYDPHAITRAQEQKRAEHRIRLAKRAERQRSAEKPTAVVPLPHQQGSTEEVEALAAAAGATAPGLDLDAELWKAFNTNGGRHVDA